MTTRRNTRKKSPSLDMSEELVAEREKALYTGAKAVGTSLSTDSLHFRYGIYESPDKQHMVEYEIAFRTNPIINRALNFIKTTMLASLGSYTHSDDRAKDYVNELLSTMDSNLLDELGQLIVSSLWSGVGVSEKIFEARDGKIFLKKLINYHPRSLTFVTNRQGELVDNSSDVITPTFPRTGVWQHIPSNLLVKLAATRKRNQWANYFRIPVNKLVIVAHNRRHGNIAGESALAPVWLSYQMLMETWQNLMITTERYGSPQVAAIVPKGITSEKINFVDPETGTPGVRPKTLAEKAVEQLSQLSSTSALVFEEPPGIANQERIRLQNISSFNNFGDNFLSPINQLYSDILVGLGVPPLLFLEHSGGLGAGAIAQVHAETYKQQMIALYHQFVEPFCEQVIGQLLYLNFGIKDPGKFTFNPFDLASADTMIKVFTDAIHHGILDSSTEEDLQWSRVKLGIPLASQESMPKRISNNLKFMEYLRRKDKDKIEIARLRADATVEATEIMANAQKENSQRQANTQKQVTKMNIEHQKEQKDKENRLKLQVEKLKAKKQPKPVDPDQPAVPSQKEES